MSKPKIFLSLLAICALLFSVNHVVHFVSPFLRLTQPADLPSTGDDLTSLEFVELVRYYQEYDWTAYNQDDFEDWLYMPAAYPADEFTLNQSENDPIPSFYGYDWDNYDPSDFPNWLCMPETLPATFNATNATYINQFVYENICPEFLEELENTFDPSGNPLLMVITPFILIYELIWGLIAAAIAIILFILSRSVD